MIMLIAVITVLALVPIMALTLFATEPEPESEPEITYVSNWEELHNAVNSDKTYIKLSNSITDDVPDDVVPTKHRLEFDGGGEYTLDLGPYMLYVRNTVNKFYTDDFSMIEVKNSSKLTVLGGNVVFENCYTKYRTCKGVVYVSDSSTLVVESTNMQNRTRGPLVYADANANVTLRGGDYRVQDGFALYMTGNASLTLDDGIYVHTVMGDCAETAWNDGYGALYSESTGDLDIQYAVFESGVQVHESQMGAFDISTHEVVINGNQITENVFEGAYYEAKQQNKEYYWYDFHMRALCYVGEEYASFVNKVRVISYDKKSPITVENGIATIGGVPVTEAYYGQEVTVTADAPEENKEFVCWAVLGGEVDYPFNSTSTFTMPANAFKIEACYGNASVSAVNVTVEPPKAGETPKAKIFTADNHSIVSSVEWFLSGVDMKLPENESFYPGFEYYALFLLNPDEDYKFADAVAVTVNGENASILSNSAGHVLVKYVFDALAPNPFDVTYKPDYQNGVDGRIEVNVDGMKTSSNLFSAALDAGKVSYQWYRDGEVIEGATGSTYTVVEEDVESYVYCVVTADGTVAYGYTVMCTKELYKVNFSLTEVVAGSRAPTLTSATPGVAINAASYAICEKYSEVSFGNVLDASQMILIPGKTYRIIAFYMVTDPDIIIGTNASFYANGNAAIKDGWRIIYDFTVPAADFDVSVTSEHEIGIGAELVAEDIAGATYQWYKNGEVLAGATSRSYLVTPKDKNSMLHCVVTKENGDYGYTSQVVIGHYITVIRISGPTPQNTVKVGDIGSSSHYSANGAWAGVFWYLGTAEDMANGGNNSVGLEDDDVFITDVNFVPFVLIKANDTYELHPNAVAYYNGIEGLYAGVSGAYRQFAFNVKAIHKHVYDDNVWAYDEYGCWNPCTLEGCPNPNEEWVMYTDHIGTATCKEPGICSKCGANYYFEDAHDIAVPNYVYIDDMKCGSYCATEGCDYLAEWSYHTGGTSDCHSKAICEICHTEYGQTMQHFGGTATCTEGAKCTACGEEYGDPLGHEPSATWTIDGEYHYKECTRCSGQQLEKAAHTSSGTATVDAAEVCTVCGHVISPKLDPTPDPAPTPTTPEEEKDGLGAGAIVVIILSSLAAAGGGFVLVLFFIKKRG